MSEEGRRGNCEEKRVFVVLREESPDTDYSRSRCERGGEVKGGS
jgi:hypothetical protein